jgi:hypothetical protein
MPEVPSEEGSKPSKEPFKTRVWIGDKYVALTSEQNEARTKVRVQVLVGFMQEEAITNPSYKGEITDAIRAKFKVAFPKDRHPYAPTEGVIKVAQQKLGHSHQTTAPKLPHMAAELRGDVGPDTQRISARAQYHRDLIATVDELGKKSNRLESEVKRLKTRKKDCSKCATKDARLKKKDEEIAKLKRAYSKFQTGVGSTGNVQKDQDNLNRKRRKYGLDKSAGTEPDSDGGPVLA